MSGVGQNAGVRLGLLGDSTDPAAQLFQDLGSESGKEIIEIVDPGTDAEAVDEILVVEQGEALAHLPGLISSGKPCRILLRRVRGMSERTVWEASLQWLMECLQQSGWTGCELVALTPEAAEDLSARLGRPVTPLRALDAIAWERPVVQVMRDASEATFTLQARDGARQTRRVDPGLFNWVRLRRLARLQSGDASDLDMGDVVAFANGVEGPGNTLPASPSTPPCLLVVVPNGVGLGHVTRMMAISKGLQENGTVRVVFWSYSRAAEILRAAGYEVILRQTAAHIAALPPAWRQWEIQEFARTITKLHAQLVVMDGGAIDPFIVEALKKPGCGRCGILWVRRGMLQPETDPLILEHEQVCDLVLEPGDLAVEMDQGPTRMRSARNKGFSQDVVTNPVTLKPFLPAYTRREAKRKLGLGWGRHVLVSLGGAFGDWELLRTLLNRQSRAMGVKLIWAQSPLAPPPRDDGSAQQVRRFYPLSRYMAAFDGMISAAGYNSYHELILGYDGPILLAPTNSDRLDDQEARARFAQRQGWADVVFATRLQDQEQVIGKFMSEVRTGKRDYGRPAFDLDTQVYAGEIQRLFDRYASPEGTE